MLNDQEIASISTTVSLSPVPSPSSNRETGPLDWDGYVPLCAGQQVICMVSPALLQGYLAARAAYADMEEHDDEGPYVFLTGYEYAHLARRYLPATLPTKDKKEWQRGFVAGWNASTFDL